MTGIDGVLSEPNSLMTNKEGTHKQDRRAIILPVASNLVQIISYCILGNLCFPNRKFFEFADILGSQWWMCLSSTLLKEM